MNAYVTPRGTVHPLVDASTIAERVHPHEYVGGLLVSNARHVRLAQGGKPPTGSHVKRAGFDMLILCAEEYQPPAAMFSGIEVVHAPNDDPDRQPTRAELAIASAAAGRAARWVLRGKSVLVTCQQGRNRSGLVSALALHYMTGMDGEMAALCVRARRKNALTNKWFWRELAKVRGVGGQR